MTSQLSFLFISIVLFIMCVTIIEWRHIIEIWICNIRLVSKILSRFIWTHCKNRRRVLLHTNYQNIKLFVSFIEYVLSRRYFLFFQSKRRSIVTVSKNPPRTQFLDTWKSKVHTHYLLTEKWPASPSIIYWSQMVLIELFTDLFVYIIATYHKLLSTGIYWSQLNCSPCSSYWIT